MAREEIASLAWRVLALAACGACGACGGRPDVPQATIEVTAPAWIDPPRVHAVVTAREDVPPAPPPPARTLAAISIEPERPVTSGLVSEPIELPQPPPPPDPPEPPPPPRLPPTVADLMSPLDDELVASASAPLARGPVVHHLASDGSALRRYGMMLDVGVPDGATAALVIRPARAIRVDAGISYNGVSNGVRGGVTLVPFASWFTPTLSIDGGHYSEGNANPLARLVTGDPMYSSPALDRVGYDYADAQVGLELGRKRFTFYLRAGATRVSGSLHDLGSLFTDSMPKSTVVFGSDPTLSVTAVSARMGFILYFGK